MADPDGGPSATGPARETGNLSAIELLCDEVPVPFDSRVRASWIPVGATVTAKIGVPENPNVLRLASRNQVLGMARKDARWFPWATAPTTNWIQGRNTRPTNQFADGMGYMAKKDVFRVVTRATDGSLKIRDFHSAELIFRTHSQVGIDDSSTDLDLRGMPIFKGLIGPIPEGKNIARYESHDVFEVMTKEWAAAKPRRRRRRNGTLEDIPSDTVDAS